MMLDWIKLINYYRKTSSYKRDNNKVFQDEFITLFAMKNTEAITSVDNKIKTDPKFESEMVIFFFQLIQIYVYLQCLYLPYRKHLLKLLEERTQKTSLNVYCTDYLLMCCQINVHGQALDQISDRKI